MEQCNRITTDNLTEYSGMFHSDLSLLATSMLTTTIASGELFCQALPSLSVFSSRRRGEDQ